MELSWTVGVNIIRSDLPLETKHLPLRSRGRIARRARTGCSRGWLRRGPLCHALVFAVSVAFTSVSEATVHRSNLVKQTVMSPKRHSKVAIGDDSAHDSVSAKLMELILQNSSGYPRIFHNAVRILRRVRLDESMESQEALEKVLRLMTENKSDIPRAPQQIHRTLTNVDEDVNLLHYHDGIHVENGPTMVAQALVILICLATVLCTHCFIIFLLGCSETTESFSSNFYFNVFLAVFLTSVVYICVLFYAASILGDVVTEGIRNTARDDYGLHVHMGSLKVDPIAGRVTIRDMRLLNPEGFTSEFLIQLQSGFVDVGMNRFIWSGGRHLKFASFQVNGLNIICETNSNGSNNAKEVLAHLHDGANETNGTNSSDDTSSSIVEKVTFHKVAFVHMRVKVVLHVLGITLGGWINLPNVIFDDFDKEVGSLRPDVIGQFFLRLLLEKVTKRIGI
eukprot:TRINITY_DN18618_c0_g1_i1.p1 TRINITY_DN18618_c0_g1~~TRINITY_DN18618_c0_g1_i1.p1  ORF type:complete len:451 (-),score=53.92 TRINITY_DN18618_c0_g1_i1:401-1753(-)